MPQNTTTAQTLYDTWNRRDFDHFAELMADGEIVSAGSGQRFEGANGARAFASMWADAFPDGRIAIDNVIEAGDHVAVEFTGTGTQTGTLASQAGDIPATGRSVTLKFCDVFDFREGKIASIRTYFDSTALLTQLGVMPEAEAARTA